MSDLGVGVFVLPFVNWEMRGEGNSLPSSRSLASLDYNCFHEVSVRRLQ